jgi:hypothetical protein
MKLDRRKNEKHSPKAWLLAFVAFAIALLLLRMWVFAHGKHY